MAEVVVFVSPHLDDVVLSCVARIEAEARAGCRVIVATVFSTGDGTREARRQYRCRRAEDAAVARILGVESVQLGLPDAPFRRSHYRSFRQIVFETDPDDEGYEVTLGERLAALCATQAPVRLYAPLAVGAHIDHRLTHAAVASMQRPDVLYYEDRPYSLIRYATRLHLDRIGLRPAAGTGVSDFDPGPGAHLLASFLESFDRTTWTHTYLPPSAEREACKSLLAAALAGGAQVAPAGRCVVELQTCPGDALPRVLAAITGYASQFRDLFASREDFLDQAKAYARHVGIGAPYVERYWRISRPGATRRLGLGAQSHPTRTQDPSD